MSKRILSPQEINHLQKHGFSDIDLGPLGEKPVEYITGHAEFCHLDFLVNESTLIPRLESEKIIQIALDHIANQNIPHPTIADIGTGSGCLGLSLAVALLQKQVPYTIFLSDISSSALNVAKENASRLLPSPANIFFEQSDLLENFPRVKFDILMANLPYIPSKNISSLHASVKNFEPLSALDGGFTGTQLINRLLKDLPRFLSTRGIAILEFDDTHTLQDFALPHSLFARIENDLFGISRFLIVQQKS